MFGRARERIHEKQASSRPLSTGYEAIGILGEAEFAFRTGLPFDVQERPAGDNRVDFFTELGTIDVKTARKPYNLIREVGKPHAEILVLVGVDASGWAKLIGWEYDSIITDAPFKDFGYSILNHYIPAENLKSPDLLVKMIAATVADLIPTQA
tara:strand:+ start:569 stop:1027 length:459 start_codon:yes stop_codon:yes gene_type:complete